VTFLDTSVIIDFLAGDQKIVANERNLEERRCQNHTITEYELLRNKAKIKKQSAERCLSGVTVCSFDREAAKKPPYFLKNYKMPEEWLMKTICLLHALYWRMMRFY
jgi:hypothetical protein